MKALRTIIFFESVEEIVGHIKENGEVRWMRMRLGLVFQSLSSTMA